MLTKTLLLAFSGLAALASAASTPGCLIGAVNSYDDVSDISGICKQKDAAPTIAKVCGDKTEAALAAFADVCNGVGVDVSTKLPASVTATATGSGHHAQATATGYFNGTSSGSAGGSGTGATTLATATQTGASATGTGAPIATGAAARSSVGMGIGALVAGLMVAAL